MGEIERRYTPSIVELRSPDSDKNRIGGYAAVFNKLSRNLGGFVEQVSPSAFNQSRAAGWPEVIARYNHDDNMLLGTSEAGTLELRIDETGLYYAVEPPKSRQDIVELVARGDVRRSSFAFSVMPEGEEWGLTDQGYPMRSLQGTRLIDVAPVNVPAYPDATVGLRSLAKHMNADIEDVREMAQADELRKFFIRTDGPSTKTPAKKIFGPAAVAQLLAKKEDPYV